MGLASRDKGKRGERLLVEELKRAGFTHARRGQQVSGRDMPDVVVEGIGGPVGLRFECKHGASSATVPKSLYTQIRKLSAECTPVEFPFLCLHRTEANAGGQSIPWLGVVLLDHFTAVAIRWLRALGYRVEPPLSPALSLLHRSTATPSPGLLL